MTGGFASTEHVMSTCVEMLATRIGCVVTIGASRRKKIVILYDCKHATFIKINLTNSNNNQVIQKAFEKKNTVILGNLNFI